jgi:hypothetical protein
MYFARLAVADWDRAHPGVKRETRARMKQLLETGRAQGFDEAYQMARR